MSALPRLHPRRATAPSPQICRAVPADAPLRTECEDFIRNVFARRYDARVTRFAPDLYALEQHGQVCAAAGWRGAHSGPLFLERYLDESAEALISRLAGHAVERRRIAEVGNLAATLPGAGMRLILNLAGELDRQGYEWVIFTATQELIGLFAKLGLPPLALTSADPARLGGEAQEWGRYYDTRPVVVAGRVRKAFTARGGDHA
ncbi:MAG: thermostable hemolysin [Betaproteobacteria bacterium]|nr:thermostable hemolysin [Betaproteobacteria bacterium]